MCLHTQRAGRPGIAPIGLTDPRQTLGMDSLCLWLHHRGRHRDVTCSKHPAEVHRRVKKMYIVAS